MYCAKSIVIVDDEANLVNLFREALELNSFNVTTFTDSVEALEHVKENHKKYSLIISDFKMPKLDGYQLCIKLLQYNANLKVILMSDYNNLTYDDTSRFTFLNKPIPVTRLVRIVKETLDEKVQLQQQPSKTIPNLERKYNTIYKIDLLNIKLYHQ